MIDFLQEHDYSFNSRPPEEVDIFSGRWFQATILSIHDLPRRSTDCCYGRLTGLKGFQFTTSRGGRLSHPRVYVVRTILSIHDLPRRSTDHQRSRAVCCHLSIHDLPRRSTRFIRGRRCRYHLSIHDLPRRSTIPFRSLDLVQIFQFTTSRGGRLQNSTVFISKTLKFFNTFTNFSYSFLL